MSSVTVTRIKMTAARRDFIKVEDQRNVVAVVVSTADAVLNQRQSQAPGTSASATNLLQRSGFPIAPENGSAREQNSRPVCSLRLSLLKTLPENSYRQRLAAS
jgi:hypothetical protein